MEPKYPKVHVQLTGEDSNVFHLMGLVIRAMRQGDLGGDVIEAMQSEVFESVSYDQALSVFMSWVSVS